LSFQIGCNELARSCGDFDIIETIALIPTTFLKKKKNLFKCESLTG